MQVCLTSQFPRTENMDSDVFQVGTANSNEPFNLLNTAVCSTRGILQYKWSYSRIFYGVGWGGGGWGGWRGGGLHQICFLYKPLFVPKCLMNMFTITERNLAKMFTNFFFFIAKPGDMLKSPTVTHHVAAPAEP